MKPAALDLTASAGLEAVSRAGTSEGQAADAGCPACGHERSRSTHIAFRQGVRGIKVWRVCPACRSYFDATPYDPDREVAHGEGTAFGRQASGTGLNTFKLRMYRAVADLLAAHCPAPARLFDAGCGYGGFLMEARRRGYTVAGSDILPAAVNHVRALGIAAERAFSIANVTGVADGSVDILTCLDCHYYWPDQRAELRAAWRKLRPGGYLAMRVADKSWMFAWGLALHRTAPRLAEALLARSVNDHRFSMPVRSLLRLLADCRFEIVRASPRGAIQSAHSDWTVRLSYALGGLLWATTGIFRAPGALVLARKPLS
jgi:SAM-dependent methyltransferase